MDYANPTEIWWPHPSALDDLTVEFIDEEDGGSLIHLSAPDGTECADWLSYFNETEERKATFERAFIQCLLDQIARVNNGEIQGIPDEQGTDCAGDQKDLPRSVEEHQSGSDFP